jgi:hypothetical protein
MGEKVENLVSDTLNVFCVAGDTLAASFKATDGRLCRKLLSDPLCTKVYMVFALIWPVLQLPEISDGSYNILFLYT